MDKLLLRLWREEESQDLMECALLLALISLIAVASITTVGAGRQQRVQQRRS